jgi:uncharacterized protein with PQ loop repeat
MNDVLILGYCAVFISSVAPFSQLYKVVKTHNVRDLSPSFFLLRIISEIMYVTYGLLVEDYVMVCSAIIPAFVEIIIFLYWCRYHK